MRLVFAGTPEAALPSLDALLDSRHEVVGVVTRPDARVGRGRSMSRSPVATRAAEAGLEPWVPRVTMTLGLLSAAAHVVFLAVGAEKAAPARRAFAGPPSRSTPASLLRSRTGRTTVILDEAAAALLR